MPHILRGGGAIAGPIVREEGVAGVAIHAKLVGFPVLVQLFLQAGGMGWRRVGIFLSEQGQQRTGESRDHVNGRDWPLRGMLLLDDEAASRINSGIQVGALTPQNEGVSAARTKANG